MIFDTLDHYARYAALDDSIFAALDFLRQNDLTSLSAGRIEINGDTLYAQVDEYLTKPAEPGGWEAHRRYIDIHYMLKGQERIGFADPRTMQFGEYVPEKDYQPGTGTGWFLNLFAGSFAIFFTEEGHMPGLYVNSPEMVKKVVLKVKARAES